MNSLSLKIPVSVFAVLLFASACGGDEGGGGDSADGGSGGQGADGMVGAADCSGDTDRLMLEGAFSLNAPGVGPVTVGGEVVGAAGLSPDGDMVTLSLRDALDSDLGATGTIDVSETNFKYLLQPDGVDCEETPSECEGFYTAGGTFTITEVSPRFRADFDFTDLSERLGNEEGNPIGGSVTGCLNMAETE